MKTLTLKRWAALRGRDRKLVDLLNGSSVDRRRAQTAILNSKTLKPSIKAEFAAIDPSKLGEWIELLIKYLPQLLAILIPLFL